MNEANKSKSDSLFDEWASWEAPYGELHEKLLTATNEIILLASSKKCSNAISTFDQLQTQTP